MTIRTILLCFTLVSSSLLFAKPPTSIGSSGGDKNNSSTGNTGAHIIANPDDYFLNEDLELFTDEEGTATTLIPMWNAMVSSSGC